MKAPFSLLTAGCYCNHQPVALYFTFGTYDVDSVTTVSGPTVSSPRLAATRGT